MAGPMNPYDAPESEPRRMTGTTKVLLAFGIGCGVLLLLCCGVVGFGGFASYRYFRNAVIEDPARVREITEEIATIQLPEKLQPKVGIDARVPFSGDPIMKGVVYADPADTSFLMLGQANPEYAGETANFKHQLRESLNRRDEHRHEDFEVSEPEKLETKVNGQPAEFTVTKAVNKKSNQEYWRTTGDFQGRGGPAFLVFDAKAPEFSKEQVIEILNSIK